MLSILFAAALTLLPTDIHLITDGKSAPLEGVSEIIYPRHIKVRSTRTLPMELALVKGTRRMYLYRGNTNVTILLPQLDDLKGTGRMVIKVKQPEGLRVYTMNLLSSG